MCLGVRQVGRLIRELEAAGVVTVKRRCSKANVYTLLLDVSLYAGTPTASPTKPTKAASKPTAKSTTATAPKPVEALQACPEISEQYLVIWQELTKAHPRAKYEAGSAADKAARKTLAELVRLDEYTEHEVLATLAWVLKEEPQRDGFTWRKQLNSLARLRDKKPGDAMSKFDKMHEASLQANPGDACDTIHGDPYEATRKRLEAEQMTKEHAL
jgi:hypothetical protein